MTALAFCLSRLIPSQKAKLERLFDQLYGISVGKVVDAQIIETLIEEIASEKIEPEIEPLSWSQNLLGNECDRGY